MPFQIKKINYFKFIGINSLQDAKMIVGKILFAQADAEDWGPNQFEIIELELGLLF